MGGSCPAIAADGTIYFGRCDNKVYAVNPDGSLKWTYATGGWVTSSAAIATDGTIYFGSYDHKLYALTPGGSLKWAFDTHGTITRSSPAIDTDGTIYIGNFDRKLYAVNPDGSLKWVYQTPIGNIVSSPAIGQDGTIYFGDFWNTLYALNPDGSLKWEYQALDAILSSPAIGANGNIYFGCMDHKIYALNPDGSLDWSYETGKRIWSCSPAIGDDGTVYIGGYDHKLYAFETDCGGLADSAWPKFHQNNQNTGKSSNNSAVPSQDTKVNHFKLFQNYPNPFNPETQIQFSIPVAGSVKITIYDATGRVIRTLLETELPAGNHAVHWNGVSENGAKAASGLYFCRLEAGASVKILKMMLLK
ncbi:PQQ-binding-like beta-propeller repeat protein [bacterium]|nr:PQQ-binding-like beta-propeller repeat protein [bacterium]